MTWGGVAMGVGSAVGGVAASQSGGGESGGELPSYMQKPNQRYFSQMDVTSPDGRGFWQKYDPNAYEGDWQAKMPAWYRQSMKDYRDSGTDPDSGLSQSRAYTESVLNGDYLGLSDPMRQAVVNPALDAVSSRFAKMGRSGINPANVQSQNSAAMSSLMPYFNAERERQTGAAEMMPKYDDWAFQRGQPFADYKLDQRQGNIDQDRYESNKWMNKMTAWQSLLNPNTNPQPYSNQPGGDWMSGALGGGLLGGNIASAYQNSGITPASSVPQQDFSNYAYNDSGWLGTGNTNGANAMNLNFGGQ